MKVTDYVASFLAGQGVSHVFGLTGGAVVHFFDSIAREPGIQAVFMHHEQAAAFAAQAYARVARNIGVCFVTTGPGGTNAMTGLAAAWLDSIPCLFISGQARLAHTTRGRKIRQLGTQQLDIVTLVKPLTKHAVMIEDLAQIRFELEKAVHIARSGRPGPVWVDIPLDFQWSSIEPGELRRFVPEPGDGRAVAPKSAIDRCEDLLRIAKRPLMLVGHGVRLAGAEMELQTFVERTGIPVVCSWNASDMVPASCELNLGRPGMFGQRGANLAVQNCDLLLAVGSHLCVPITGTMFPAFAREADVVVVDIDPIELAEPNVHVELPIQADAREFLRQMLDRDPARVGTREWRQACAVYRGTYNAAPQRPADKDAPIDAYAFLNDLSESLREGDTVVVDGGGTINQISFQTFRGKPGQRLMISAGLCSMGSGLPESVGACVGAGGGRTICLCGDGSFQLNVQELQTILHHNLPVKIFILNNDGYLSIRQTQGQFLGERFEGSAPSGGLTLPDATRIAEAYGIRASRVTSYLEFDATLPKVLESDGPELCEIVVSPTQDVAPRQGFRQKPDGTFAARPLEDMAPMLDPDELARVSFVRPWQD